MNSMRSALSGGKKKKWSIEPSICFICKRSGDLVKAHGFIEALIKRGDFNGVKSRRTQDQVINFQSKVFNDEVSSKIQWQKDCYSAFVSKRNLQFVSKRHLPANATIEPGGGEAFQLHLYGGVWPQDWKIDPSAD